MTDSTFDETKPWIEAAFGHRLGDDMLRRCIPLNHDELKLFIRTLIIAGKLDGADSPSEDMDEGSKGSTSSERESDDEELSESDEGSVDPRLKKGRVLADIQSFETLVDIVTGNGSAAALKAPASPVLKPRLRLSTGPATTGGGTLLPAGTLLFSAVDLLRVARERNNGQDLKNVAILPTSHRVSLLGKLDEPEMHYIKSPRELVTCTLDATKVILLEFTTCEVVADFMNQLTKMPTPNKAKAPRELFVLAGSRAAQSSMPPGEFSAAVLASIGEYAGQSDLLLQSEQRGSANLKATKPASAVGAAPGMMPDDVELRKLVELLGDGGGADDGPHLDLGADPLNDTAQQVIDELLKCSPVFSGHVARSLINNKDELDHVWTELKRKLHEWSYEAKVVFMTDVVRHFCNQSWRAADQVAELSASINCGTFQAEGSSATKKFKKQLLGAMSVKVSGNTEAPTLKELFLKWRAHWLLQKPTLLLKDELDPESRVSSVFSERKIDFKAAKAAYANYQAVESEKYTKAAIMGTPVTERAAVRATMRECIGDFRAKTGSLRYCCQFCGELLFLKHPSMANEGDVIPRTHTIQKPHQLHERCSNRSIYKAEAEGKEEHEEGG